MKPFPIWPHQVRFDCDLTMANSFLEKNCMKQAERGGGRETGVAEVADPVVADNYAKVKVWAAPLCTEFKGSGGDHRHPFGHEAAGEVVAVGPNVRFVGIGDRVVIMPQNSCGICDLCQSGDHIYCRSRRDALAICGSATGRATVAQYVIQQDWLLVPIPAGISYDHGSMACCGFGPAFNAMESMQVSAGDTVLVAGLGPVGLGAVTVALFRGATVLGVDSSEYRRDLAKEIGAHAVFSPDDEDVVEQVVSATPGGLGVQHSVQCTRAEGVGKFLVKVTRSRGRIAFIGQGGTLDIPPIVGKGLRLYGCWHWNHQNQAERMMATIAGSAERIDKMITHTFPIDRVAEAIALQQTGQCGKVIVHPWGE